MAETTESIPHLEPQNPNELPHMSDNERDRITEVFKMYETDVRSAAMHPEVSNTSFFFCSFYLLHDFALKNYSAFQNSHCEFQIRFIFHIYQQKRL